MGLRPKSVTACGLIFIAGCQTTLHVTEEGEVLSTDYCAAPFDSSWYVADVIKPMTSKPHINDLFHAPENDNDKRMQFTFSSASKLEVTAAKNRAEFRKNWADVAQFPCSEAKQYRYFGGELQVDVAFAVSYTTLKNAGNDEDHKHFIWLVNFDIRYCDQDTCNDQDAYKETQVFLGRVSDEDDPPYRTLFDFAKQGLSDDGERVFRKAFENKNWAVFGDVQNWLLAYPTLSDYWAESAKKSHNGRIHGRGG